MIQSYYHLKADQICLPLLVIEFPVVLLQWRKVKETGSLELCPADIFHTFVKPIWRPRLTQFCRDLTGIDQVSKQAFLLGRSHY